MRARCDNCGSPYEKKKRTQRFCSAACRRISHVAEKNRAPKPDPELTNVEQAAQAALADAGRLAHPAGAAALTIARRIDAGPESSAGLAALVRELRAALAEALERSGQAGDIIDELKARRAERSA